MEYTKLGTTDISISKICFGCWAIGGHGYGVVNDNDSIKAIHGALDQGIIFFDTADVYGFGHSEQVLGKALKGNDDVVVASKFGVAWDSSGKTKKDCSVKHLIRAVDDSLRRLNREAIDLYQLHWHDGVTPIGEVMSALLDLKEQGKIKELGCTNISRDLIVEASKSARIESAQLQYCLNDTSREDDISFLNQKYGVSTLAYGILGRGIFSGKYNDKSNFFINDTRKTDPNFNENVTKNIALLGCMRMLGDKYGKTTSQIAVRWVLENPSVSCALLGMKNNSQVVDNAGALGWRLAKEDRETLTAQVLALFP